MDRRLQVEMGFYFVHTHALSNCINYMRKIFDGHTYCISIECMRLLNSIKKEDNRNLSDDKSKSKKIVVLFLLSNVIAAFCFKI